MAAATGLTEEQVQQRYNTATPSGAYFVQPPVKPAVVKPTTLPPLSTPFSFANNRVAPGSPQFYQPAYQPQYQNYANPYTAFGVSTYGTQPMTSTASSWAAGQGLGQQHVTNTVNSWLQQNPGADMNTMLNAMRGAGINAYDVQGAGGYGNYAPQSSVFGQPMQGGMPRMNNPYSVQQPQTNYGPSRAIVSRSASMRGTPNVVRRAGGGIADLVTE